ncbi:phage BR0599 family protein [Marinobacter sp. JSM 1782161]|uniref:phage BR0599 family protein n=1 Tax=Marinobacter sp. JSM 1782161 TaxID=2685906 RepID=UPI001402D30A|nr:phage BR0599 family protein [Marinobacter sp. JSM 1782161]
MTYTAQDQSVQDGDPFLLFLFVRGTQQWRYTYVDREVTAMGETWAPAAITPGNVEQTEDINKGTLTLEFPRDNEFAATFLGYSPEQVTSVTIFRGHFGDSDGEFITWWKGRVAGTEPSEDSVSMECEPLSASMRRSGLTARYQKTCRHALYGRGCRLDKADWAVPATLTSLAGLTATVPEASAFADGYFAGGMIETAEGLLYFATAHAGSALTLIRPSKVLANALADSSGEIAITIYPGCDHTRAICLNKFDNLNNFGGFPWIPGKNPFGGSSIV